MPASAPTRTTKPLPGPQSLSGVRRLPRQTSVSPMIAGSQETEVPQHGLASPVAKEGGNTNPNDQHTDGREIGREPPQSNQQGCRRGRCMASPQRDLPADRQGDREGARGNARHRNLARRHGRRSMERPEQGKRQKGRRRSNAMSNKRIPGPGGVLVRRDGMNEDRRPETGEQPRLLKQQAKAADNSRNDKGDPPRVKRNAQPQLARLRLSQLHPEPAGWPGAITPLKSASGSRRTHDPRYTRRARRRDR